MFLRKVGALGLWGRRPVRVLGIVTLLLLALCGIQMLMPKTSLSCGEGYTFGEGVPTEETVVYSGIALKPGVYYVEMQYEASWEGTEYIGHTSLKDGGVVTGGLKTNGEHIYAGLKKTGYHVWLYEGTKDLAMVVSYGGKGQLRITGYTITETNRLWTMLATCLVFGACLVFCLMVYYYYDKAYRIGESPKRVFFFVALISLFASLPYLCGGNLPGIDLTYHLQRIEGVKDGLLGGQFPVRIEPEWLYGHGYGAGVFYCNSLLYFPAILRLLGFPVSAAYNIFCIVLTIATAWIAYGCFSRIFKSDRIGLVCCALYTLSVFRIYKLVNTCAVGEGSAVMFLPLVLYGMYQAFAEDSGPGEQASGGSRPAWPFIAIGYGGLMQTHILTCEITAFLTIVVCLAGIKRIFRKKTFLELAKGALGAIGLSLWFLVPFLDFYLTQDVHIKHLSARRIQDTGMTLAHLAFQFWRNGNYTPNGQTGVYQSHPVGVGLVLVLGLGMFLVLWLGGAFRGRKGGLFLLAKISALLGILLLFMGTNAFPWDWISGLGPLAATLVSSLEFTHRVMGWGTLFLVTVGGFCLWYFRQENRGHYLAAVVVAIVCVVSSGVYMMDFVIREGGAFYIYNEEGMGFGYVSDGEYLPEGTEEGSLTFVDKAAAGAGVTVDSYEKQYLHVKMQCRNPGRKESYLEVPLLFYKGYRAWDAEGNPLGVGPGENYMVRVFLPPGFAGSVEVKFVSPFYWRLSELVSGIFLVFFLWAWRRRTCSLRGCAQ